MQLFKACAKMIDEYEKAAMKKLPMAQFPLEIMLCLDDFVENKNELDAKSARGFCQAILNKAFNPEYDPKRNLMDDDYTIAFQSAGPSGHPSNIKMVVRKKVTSEDFARAKNELKNIEALLFSGWKASKISGYSKGFDSSKECQIAQMLLSQLAYSYKLDPNENIELTGDILLSVSPEFISQVASAEKTEKFDAAGFVSRHASSQKEGPGDYDGKRYF